MSPVDQKILIVAGHPVYINKMQGFLEGLTFRNIVLAKTGQEGIQKSEAEKPRLVIMSGILPDMDAFEVCKMIKEKHALSRIIVQVGLFTEKEDIEKFKDLGADIILDRKEKDLSPLQEAVISMIS